MTMREAAVRDLDILGSKIRIQLSGADTGGAFTIVDDTTPPGVGPPPHVHQREDEGFFVVEGEVEVLKGDRWIRVPAGTGCFAPRGVPHTYRNVGSTPSRMLVTICPAGFEGFFVEVDRLSQSGPPSPETLTALAAKFGVSFLPPG